MGLETVTYISDLVITNPTVDGLDPRAEGDDHLRNIKKGLKNSFPSVSGPVNATQAELNLLVGIPAGSLLAAKAATNTLLQPLGLKSVDHGAVNSFAVDLALYNMVAATRFSGSTLTITVSNRLNGRFCCISYYNNSGSDVAVTWVGLAGGALFLPNATQVNIARQGHNLWELTVMNSVERIIALNSFTLTS